jgi:hypothetical protein
MTTSLHAVEEAKATLVPAVVTTLRPSVIVAFDDVTDTGNGLDGETNVNDPSAPYVTFII